MPVRVREKQRGMERDFEAPPFSRIKVSKIGQNMNFHSSSRGISKGSTFLLREHVHRGHLCVPCHAHTTLNAQFLDGQRGESCFYSFSRVGDEGVRRYNK